MKLLIFNFNFNFYWLLTTVTVQNGKLRYLIYKYFSEKSLKRFLFLLHRHTIYVVQRNLPQGQVSYYIRKLDKTFLGLLKKYLKMSGKCEKIPVLLLWRLCLYKK